jgi:sulfate adenylyltransferase subunit 2
MSQSSLACADRERIFQLENDSIFFLREAYRTLPKVGMLWSMGKDSTVMLYLARKAFFGRVPFPVVHIDTSFKIPAMIEFRDHLSKEWNLDLRISQNKKALDNGMNPSKGRLDCCASLKTFALKAALLENDLQSIFAAIRRDEEGSRGKERVFSPRGRDSTWAYTNQPPEIWNNHQTEFERETEVRIHPMLAWSELDIWLYIKEKNLPVLDLYFAKNGERYRSVGCAPCTGKVSSKADTLEQIILELRTTTVGERSGRAQDSADRYAMQKLRAKGYM